MVEVFSLKSPRHGDPFEIPARIIPAGVSYQWVVRKKSAIDPQYQTMMEAGWRPVPYGRHDRDFTTDYCGASADFEFGGMVLMERPRDESNIARDREMDKACFNSGNGRRVGVNLTIGIRLSQTELSAAIDMGMTGGQYAARRLQMIADGSDESTVYGWDGSLMFTARPEELKMRVPRHPWLHWLFEFISTEKCS